jgi:hypothetical protein
VKDGSCQRLGQPADGADRRAKEAIGHRGLLLGALIGSAIVGLVWLAM